MQYVAFCAVVVLYIFSIQQRTEGQDSWIEYLQTGEKCQNHLAHIATEHSLVQRYIIVLEELRLEATVPSPLRDGDQGQKEAMRDQQMERTNPSVRTGRVAVPRDPTREMGLIPSTDEVSGAATDSLNYVPEQFHASEESGATAWNSSLYEPVETPSSVLANLTSWAGFDSLVSYLCWHIKFSSIVLSCWSCR